MKSTIPRISPKLSYIAWWQTVKPLYLHSMIILIALAACQPFYPRLLQSPESNQTPSINSTSLVTPNQTSLPTVTPTSQLKVETSDMRGSTLKFWHIWSGDMGNTLDTLVAEFNEKNEWGIKVEASYQGGYDEMYDYVYKAINTGDLPHIVMGYPYQAASWKSIRDIILDLQPYLIDPVWGLKEEEQQDFLSVFWAPSEKENQSIGIPAQGSAQVLYYNLTWAKQLGFPNAPLTPDLFKEQACAAAKANKADESKENDNTGGWIISSNYAAVLGWMYSFHADILKSGGEGYQFNTPEIKDVFFFLRKLFEDGCSWSSENQFTGADFASRRALFVSGSITEIPRQIYEFSQAGNKDEWTVIPYPSITCNPVINAYESSFHLIESTPAEQLASWLWVKWLVDPQNQYKLIQSSTTYPVQSSVLEKLKTVSTNQPQYLAALDLLPVAQHEPTLESWLTVRWAVGDASRQLYQWYFTIDKVPSVAKLLDSTANDLHQMGE